MFISEKNKKATLRTLFIYVGVTLFVALFGGIYEIYSHNVYSANMVFAWAFTLGFGVGMYLLLYLLPIKQVPGLITSSIYHLGVALLTFRSIFIGVLEIYGTTNEGMVLTYSILSGLLVGISGLAYLIIIIYSLINRNKEPQNA